jgi:hypothetical protein
MEQAAEGIPIAEVWCFQSSLMFKWRPEAKDQPAAEQLRNAVLRFTLASRHQLMVLREAMAEPIYTLDLSDRQQEITVALAHPPKAESLQLEVIGARQLPVNAYFQNEQAIVAIPAAPMESELEVESGNKNDKKPAGAMPPTPAGVPARVTVMFDDLAEGEQPQLWIEPRVSADHQVTIRFAPRIVRGKIVNELTKKSLELYRVPRDEQIARVERDWKNANDTKVGLDRRIAETRQNINATVPIKTLQSRLAAADREYRQLDEKLKRIKAELAWVEAAEKMIASLHAHGQLKYRVFAKSGDLQVDLVRAGLE